MSIGRRCLTIIGLGLSLGPWIGCAGVQAAQKALTGVSNPPVPLAAHRASYVLALQSIHGSETVAASGSMTYQVTDACTGWATQQQLRLHTVTRDGGASDLVSDYATLESKDGHHLSFDMTQRSNGAITEHLRGEATLESPVPGAPGAPGHIRYTLPHPAELPLPAGTLFPMAHTEAIIQGSRAGLKNLSLPLFDGTGTDGPQDTYVTLLGWHPGPSATDQPVLAALGSTRVHVAFFSRSPGTITPDYESGMRYFDNGVADRLTMDFGDFTMQGTLQDLKFPGTPNRC